MTEIFMTDLVGDYISLTFFLYQRFIFLVEEFSILYLKIFKKRNGKKLLLSLK